MPLRTRVRLAMLLCLAFAGPARAHPVPVQTYDRTVVVRLTPTVVVVEYVLEVDSFTALKDVPSLISEAERKRITKSEQVHEAFARASAPILANNLLARLDGKTLTFTCKDHKHAVTDHLRCEYRFEAAWQPAQGKRHEFTFRETNYDEEPGAVRLSLTADPALKLVKVTQPDEKLKNLPLIDQKPGDQQRLINASATFEWSGAKSEAPPAAETPQQDGPAPKRGLQDLLFDSEAGLWALLSLAAFLGAVHALTPGHGKTLVAAYLVGQRGTAGQAVLLGVVTTLTHTGAVLLVAAVLPWLFPGVKPSDMQQMLGFIGGLLIAVLGFWLLQRRLAGKADHFHLGGGHHHHHHHEDDQHHHHESGEPPRLKGLILLGISGGIVPCGEALALFLLAIRWQRLELAFWLLLAFSAGLAVVLVGIGLGVVYAQRLTLSRWKSAGSKRLVRVLPIVSAVLVTALGLWLCYDSVHGAQH